MITLGPVSQTEKNKCPLIDGTEKLVQMNYVQKNRLTDLEKKLRLTEEGNSVPTREGGEQPPLTCVGQRLARFG